MTASDNAEEKSVLMSALSPVPEKRRNEIVPPFVANAGNSGGFFSTTSRSQQISSERAVGEFPVYVIRRYQASNQRGVGKYHFPGLETHDYFTTEQLTSDVCPTCLRSSSRGGRGSQEDPRFPSIFRRFNAEQ